MANSTHPIYPAPSSGAIKRETPPPSPGPSGRGSASVIWSDQERAGNTPCKAMMKVRPKKGGMLLWGWLPPAIDSANGLIGTLLAGTDGVYKGGLPKPADAQEWLVAPTWFPDVEATAV